MSEDKFKDECGIIGLFSNDDLDVAGLLYFGLFGIQHRGQQSTGISVYENGKIKTHKSLGLVSEAFCEQDVINLSGGTAGIGHCGYFKHSENLVENVQPLVFNYKKGQMAIAFSGSILNAVELKNELEEDGMIFHTTSNAEIIATLLAKERANCDSIEEAMKTVVKKINGTYAILILRPNKIVALRDPYGMKPLCFGKIGNSIVFASETATLNSIGAEVIRDVAPGEIIVAEKNGYSSYFRYEMKNNYMCMFEFVYLARTDSVIDGVGVYDARYEAGRVLAQEDDVKADLVVGVPDSGLTAALGYASESKIPYVEGIVKNRYIGRTFIQPTQELRERSVGIKLNALKSQVEGKIIILVDDSIVRGTTSKKIVQVMKEVGGAKEVHLRISSPPVKFPCIYGVDTPDANALIANIMSHDEIADLVGADSLRFISNEGLLRTPIGARCGFCDACFSGNYQI